MRYKLVLIFTALAAAICTILYKQHKIEEAKVVNQYELQKISD